MCVCVCVCVCETPSWKLNPDPCPLSPHRNFVFVERLSRQWCIVVLMTTLNYKRFVPNVFLYKIFVFFSFYVNVI